MKKTFYLLLALGTLAISCSDDNNSSDSNSSSAYLPIATGNYWVYNTQSSQLTGRDSLYTANDTVIGSTTYKKFKTGAMPTGFFSGALSGNGVKVNGSKLMLSGGTSLAFAADLPLVINVTDFVFFDANASTGSTLGTTTGTITQPTTDGYDLSINYTLTSTAQNSLPSYTAPDGTTYTNVKVVQLQLNLGVNAVVTTGGFTVPIVVMTPQNVLTSTQYYAENIGAVYVSTDINYQLQDFSSLGVTLPIPTSGSEHQDEVLDAYHIN